MQGCGDLPFFKVLFYAEHDTFVHDSKLMMHRRCGELTGVSDTTSLQSS
jgi:hypothetical protein